MERRYTLDKVIRFAGIALLCVAVFFVVRYLSGVLLPFFLACFLAYLLYPLVCFVQYRLRVRIRAVATVITLLFVIVVVAGIVWLIIPPMVRQFETLGEFISNYAEQRGYTRDVIPAIRDFLRDNEDSIRSYFEGGGFSDALSSVMGHLMSFLGYTVNAVISVIASCIVVLYMFFILQDYEYLASNWVRMFPEKVRPFWSGVMSDVEKALNSYIRGQGLVALCMGVMFCIGFTIIDFPMAIGLGILIGILDLVPYLHAIALIPTALLAMLKAADTGQNFWIIFGSAVLVFAVVQVITDFVTIPKIMGRAMGLNPAVLLLALSVWGSLLGFIGLILALPLTTLIFAYWRRYITKEENEGSCQREQTSLLDLPSTAEARQSQCREADNRLPGKAREGKRGDEKATTLS
ncbi:MAG: AI-2E family transporter [Prevotella sp.]|nr:AI-2E family transporter [Prevotella sp.]